jgi:hypothetical protein
MSPESQEKVWLQERPCWSMELPRRRASVSISTCWRRMATLLCTSILALTKSTSFATHWSTTSGVCLEIINCEHDVKKLIVMRLLCV